MATGLNIPAHDNLAGAIVSAIHKEDVARTLFEGTTVRRILVLAALAAALWCHLGTGLVTCGRREDIGLRPEDIVLAARAPR